MKKIILASKSPARKEVLEELGIPFEVIVSKFEEDMTLPLSGHELALYLSNGKAESLSKEYPTAVIIAADTFTVFNGKFLGKPKDEEDAKNMLRELAGNTHRAITGLTVAQGNKKVSKVVCTEVTMKKFDQKKIDEYVATGEPLGKAGSYAIQGKGKDLVESVNGDYLNVIGMPLETFVHILNSHFEMKVSLPKNIPIL